MTVDLRGMPAGMTVFYISVGGSLRHRRKGWEGSIANHYPTFYVIGGNELDAIANAYRMLGIGVGEEFTSQPGMILETLHITATRAEWGRSSLAVSLIAESGCYRARLDSCEDYYVDIVPADNRWMRRLMSSSGEIVSEVTDLSPARSLEAALSVLETLSD